MRIKTDEHIIINMGYTHTHTLAMTQKDNQETENEYYFISNFVSLMVFEASGYNMKEYIFHAVTYEIHIDLIQKKI